MSDGRLIEQVRRGNTVAYAELWQRHRDAAVTVARLFTTSIDAEDLVSEAYAQVLEAIQNGGGPTGGTKTGDGTKADGPTGVAFRPYLYTVVRNLARRWGSTRREITVDQLPDVSDENDSLNLQLDTLDQGMVRRAFLELPKRWQEVLWYTEVENLSPAQVSKILGISPNSVAALAYRAREGLRTRWLQEHVAEAQRAGECSWALERVGEYSRDAVTPRHRIRLENHLAGCTSCANIASEVSMVSSQLATVLAPIFLGGAAGVWLQAIGHGSGGAAAAAAPTAVGLGIGAGLGAGTSGASVGVGTCVGAGAAVGAGTGFGGALLAGAASVVTVIGLTGSLVLGTVPPSSAEDNHREESAQAVAEVASKNESKTSQPSTPQAAEVPIAAETETTPSQDTTQSPVKLGKDEGSGTATSEPEVTETLPENHITETPNTVDHTVGTLPKTVDELVDGVVDSVTLVVDEVTDVVSETVNKTTDAANRLVSDLTNDAVTADANIDLDLKNPQVDVDLGVGGAEAEVGVELGEESVDLGVSLGIEGLLDLDLDVDLGDNDSLLFGEKPILGLGLGLFGK